MADPNPYAPPQSQVDGGGSSAEYWREGKTVLYIARGSDLPARCVKCNSPVTTPIRSRKLYWHHSGWYLFLFLDFFPYLIVALIVRKKFDVSPGLCGLHSAALTKKRMAAWSLVAISLGASWYAMGSRDAMPLMVALLALLSGMILAVVSSRIVYPVEISRDYARLKGFGEPFLASVSAGRSRHPGHAGTDDGPD